MTQEKLSWFFSKNTPWAHPPSTLSDTCTHTGILSFGKASPPLQYDFLDQIIAQPPRSFNPGSRQSQVTLGTSSIPGRGAPEVTGSPGVCPAHTADVPTLHLLCLLPGPGQDQALTNPSMWVARGREDRGTLRQRHLCPTSYPS